MAAWIEERDGKLTVRFKYRGRYGRRRVPDKKTARILVREIETFHALGRHWIPADKSPAADPCLTEILKDRAERGRRSLASSTRRGRRAGYILFVDFLRTIKPRGKLHADMLSERIVLRFYDWLIDSRSNKERTARLRLGQIMAFWRWAAGSEDWRDHVPPCPVIEMPRPVASAPKTAPTWAEADAMIECLAKRSNIQAQRAYKLCVVMRYTGLRVSQAMRLLWSDFDLDGLRLTIRPELGKTSQERLGRVIPISPHLAEEMARWGVRDGWVHGKNKAYMPAVSDYLRLAWGESDVDPSRWQNQSAHAFRRSFTSELVSRGADRWAVEILCGRSTGVGGDIYTDPRFIVDKLEHAVSLVTKIGADDQRVQMIKPGSI